MRSGPRPLVRPKQASIFWVQISMPQTLQKTGRLVKFAYSYTYSYSYGENFSEGPMSPHDVLLENFCADSYSGAGG
jgi:hypothetical protein